MRYHVCATLLLLAVGCKTVDCTQLPTSFGSFQEAEDLIAESRFVVSDEVNTDRSSWIRGARYYSCDNQTGFFILVTDGGEYIHQNLPIQLWNGFKAASSYGSFYNRHIKHRYPLIVHCG